MQEQQILSHYENDIATDIKENRSLRQVDVFLSDLHSSDDHDLLRGPLTNTIVPDMASSTTSPVVSETTLSTSIGNGNHLPELPPSPILANISPDFLVGGSSSAPKTSPSSQPSFLPSLSTTTENLALSFSSHFLENSNMSIDIGNLSEGDASLNVPSHPFSDSLDSSGGKRSLGNELTFTNALKNATEKSHYDKSPRSSSEADIVSSNFLSGAKHLTHMDSLSFKGNSVITTATRTSPEIFKVPSQAKHSLNYESFPSPSKQNSFSAKEIPLIKIDSSEPHNLHKMQSSKVPESLVEEVSCFKCQLCSYLSLDKREINEHMKVKHENSLIEAIDSHLNVNSEEKISVKKELFPIKKRKKKESKKVSNKGLSYKKVKKEVAPQMKVELLPNKKGGFQKNIVLVNEEDADEQTSSLDSQEMVENSIYRSALISMQSSNSSFRFRTEDTLKETKLDFICDENNVNRKSNAMLPSSSGLSSSEDEVDEASNHSTNKVSDTSVNKSICQNGYKVQNKVGRPTASQTMGIGKFKKSHPKVPVTDETLGIKCGINGCGLRYTKLMNGHWKTHSNERPFLCDVCGKDFKTAKQLRSHKFLKLNFQI
ncbi:hypothetical protein Avbf_12225 [Armadillidium vulgare]|nr:hypothetical protein Avbf_12225 [Armadillidium vulgare]